MTPQFVSLALVLLLSSDASSQLSVKKGFELQFKSSPEELENVPMSFLGGAPSWLNGTLVRDGPALFEIGNESVVTSTLDGFAKVALWNFTGNGSILFTTKFIRSTYYKESLSREKFTSNIFVSPPLPQLSPAEVLRSQEVGIDNMDINIIEVKDPESDTTSYVAINDILSGYELSLDGLSTLGKKSPKLGNSSQTDETPEFLKRLSTSHPLPEYNTDNLINVVLQAGVEEQEANVLKVIRIKSTEETEEIASFEIPEVPLLHSFGLTPTSVIILMNPYIMNATCRMENEDNCYKWKEGNESTTIYVVDIPTGKVQAVGIPKIFVYHHINSYNDGTNRVIVDVASYDSPIPHTKFELPRLMVESERNLIDPRAVMKRITITLDTASATISNMISPTPASELASTLDYPVINEKYRSTKYCYVYGIIEKTDSVNFEAVAVAKKDVCSDGIASDAIYVRPGWFPSEPIFVPAPGATREDDGVLLVPFTSGESKRTNLVVLDAGTMQFIDMAEGPILIPQSQHGRYLDV